MYLKKSNLKSPKQWFNNLPYKINGKDKAEENYLFSSLKFEQKSDCSFKQAQQLILPIKPARMVTEKLAVNDEEKSIEAKASPAP